jgi:geranylgeranyl diphosphate synthase type II
MHREGAARCADGRSGHRVHTIYLAVIAILLVVIVYVGARAIQAHRTIREVEERFGLRDGIRSSVPRAEPLRAAAPGELLKERTYDEYREEVDGLIERALALGEFGEGGQLSEACAYALRGGKRLRPIIILEICRAATAEAERRNAGKGPLVDPADAALFIEYLHAASLVIDDLPAFDDDDVRRGAKTVHAATSPAVAQMTALALVSAAFQDICRQIDWVRDNCPEFKNVDRIGTRLCHDASRALGAMGAAGGQFMDSALTGPELFRDHGPGAIMKIVQLKTATFYEIAFLTGWLVAGAPAEDADDVQRAGRHFGTAFQIADDIGDMAQDAARRAAGKPGWNFANHYGEEEARRVAAQNLSACRLILEEKQLHTPLWREIYEKVWGMAAA